MGWAKCSPGLYMVKLALLNCCGVSLSWLGNREDPGMRAPSWFSAVDARTISAGAPRGFGMNEELSMPAGNGWWAAGGERNGLGQKLNRNMAKSWKFCIINPKFQYCNSFAFVFFGVCFIFIFYIFVYLFLISLS